MENTNKETYEWNILGIVKMKSESNEPPNFWKRLLLICILLAFVLAVIYMLKQYAIPVIGIAGGRSIATGIATLFKGRAP